MKTALIINPFAGRRRAAPRVRRLAEKMAADRGVALTVEMIQGPGHGRELARQAVSAGAERVLCVGGDGTLNAVAAGLIGTGVPLGIVPAGSGNGYAHSLGLPGEAKKALRVALLSLYTRRADRLRYIRSIPAAEADLFQDGTLAHLDGEPVAIGTFVRFRLEPRGLPVIVP